GPGAVDHDQSVHFGRDARRVPHRSRATQGIGLRPGIDDDGSRVGRGAPLHALCRHRWRVPRSWPRTRRNDGGHVRARQRAPAYPVAARARELDRRDDRERIRRSGLAYVPLLADRTGLRVVPGDVRRVDHRAADAAPAPETAGQL
ncbi:MAG: Phosphate transport system permease protein PstC, partial [uncultured Lysobacter sp.]